jgi:hypothetical protein
MSIKIYEGYRVPIAKLIESIQWIHDYQMDLAYEWLNELASQKMSNGSDRPTTKIVERCIRAIHQQENSPFNLERGLNLWLDESFAYIIPYGQGLSGACPDYFEDFHYQNSCDPPDDVATEDYENRLTKWESVGAFHFDRTLNHSTIGNSIDIYRLESRWIEEVWNNRLSTAKHF